MAERQKFQAPRWRKCICAEISNFISAPEFAPAKPRQAGPSWSGAAKPFRASGRLNLREKDWFRCAPAEATEIEPVSSETSTTRQSLSSVIPMAARCRVPSCFEIMGFSESGKETSGCRHARSFDDHGAVMQGRAGPENRNQQVVGKFGVQRNAAFNISAQPGLPLDDDQRADAILGKIFGGHDDVVVRALRIARRKTASWKDCGPRGKAPCEFPAETK